MNRGAHRAAIRTPPSSCPRCSRVSRSGPMTHSTGAIVWLLLRAPVRCLIVSAAVIAMRGQSITNPQDYYGGLALIGLALFAFWAASDLSGMRGFSFGPGTAPRLFCGSASRPRHRRYAVGLFMEGSAPRTLCDARTGAGDDRDRLVRGVDPPGRAHHRQLPRVHDRVGGSQRDCGGSRHSIAAVVLTAFCVVPVRLRPEPAVPTVASVLLIGRACHD